MSRFGIAFIIAALSFGCVKRNKGEFSYLQESGNAKPIVAIVPVIDRTVNDLSWNLSDELTTSLQHRLMQKEQFYLVDQEKISHIVKTFTNAENPFGSNLQWIKKSFSNDEFIVFLEFIEHEEVPVKTQHNSTFVADNPSELNMSVRLRILDLREEKPRVVLQELVHNTHFIPRQFTKLNFAQIPWGKESYEVSPLGLAHAQLIKELASRIEDYIVLAKNN